MGSTDEGPHRRRTGWSTRGLRHACSQGLAWRACDEQHQTMMRQGERVKGALEGADLAAISELLDPAVRWGPPEGGERECRNRDEVLAWWRRARARGVRAQVFEVLEVDERIVVGLRITGSQRPDAESDAASRWQVLVVRGGLITDIRGFDERAEALARAGLA